MNGTRSVILLTLLLFLGCASPQYTDVLPAQLDLVTMTPLPPLTSISNLGGLKLNALFRLLNDGTVAEIKLLRSSSDPKWDAQAIDSMKLWRFTPFSGQPTPTDRWIRFAIVVQIQEPIVMTLGELVSLNLREADSLYLLLQQGAQFDSLARSRQREASSGTDWFFPSVNIARYPHDVRQQLTGLPVNGYTHPLRVGAKYLIYKRFRCDSQP
jgi:TonB family protein